MERRDLAAALYHLDRIACPRTDRHRLEVERVLLTLIAEVEADERLDAAVRLCRVTPVH